MATTFTTLKRFLDESGLKYEPFEEQKLIAVGFMCDPDETTYRDFEGDAHVQVIVRLVEGGEMLVVFAPKAWQIGESENVRAVCEAAARIQARMKLIRFDFDDSEGHLQPNVEIPLESSPLCAQQLHRGLSCVLLAIRQFDAVIRHAAATGKVDFDLMNKQSPEPPPDVMRIIDLANEAGGIDAVERLLGDGDAPPVGT